MQNDKITLQDLSVFSAEEGGSVFELLDFTTTHAGREMLRRYIKTPPASLEQLIAQQDVVKYFSANGNVWPECISNGTLVMLEKFFESADSAAAPSGGLGMILGSKAQKLINKTEYEAAQFSLSHISDFLKGCKALTELLSDSNLPSLLKTELDIIQSDVAQRLTDEIIATNTDSSYKEIASLNYKARREMKNPILRLMHAYAKLDVWRSLAIASQKHNWSFPVLVPSAPPVFEVLGLYHPFLSQPVSYDITLNKDKNFLVLTGANMSGKTTFMRALGVASLLAHIGCGVPARQLKISFLQSIITNMHVEDSLVKGESYFFAEVKRMKQTAVQLSESGPNLVLMDELFKGTNVHDAYECTKAVIDGLIGHKEHILVLSTHLYEVAQHFNENPSISFYYFVTEMSNEEHFRFTYELRPGISNDRIGYKILQKEGVISLLNKKSS
ncbi:MAG: hypothetical protein JST82_12065 [Bacteroidetes bacterium]|nr:hypothetical protein [Bacteroidota bacterium]